ncbi:MAG TPA: DNA alkylation repair protein [Gemmatimonadaceae bacterium]|nr:DNA alkylation repair protein [Gemmatimonadaceae bacterium]
MSYSRIHRELVRLGTPARVTVSKRYFKTDLGEYGHGDKFLGLSVPAVRSVARAHRDLPLREVTVLLESEWHEERQLALLILVDQYRRGDQPVRDAIHTLYLRSAKYVNNWDLVDCSAAYLVGPHLPPGKRGLLTRLAKSNDIWERRIAMLSTLSYIKQGEFADTLRIATLLLEDEEDLIHKAVGWMLREVGNRDREVEERFLRQHAHQMPRTMLRYAIEKFPEHTRRHYLGL